LQARFLFF